MDVGALLATQTVVLNDGVTTATIYPVWDGSQLPLELVASLWVEYNAEIDRGCSFPETHKLMLDTFERTWFTGVVGVMVRGGPSASLEDLDFLGSTACLGSFSIEPCYPGRSSHICTAKFLVNSRNRACGIGLRLAACFMDWAPRLGYDYALFDLVYATNTAFCRILNHLNFQTLTRLKGAGILRGYDFPVDALKFGRPLLTSGDGDEAPLESLAPLPQDPHESTSTQRLDTQPSLVLAVDVPTLSTPSTPLMATASNNSANGQTMPGNELAADPDYAIIKLYLETGAYPEHASRVEKTRLRSRARSYYVENRQLRFKRTGALVVADPQEQLRIASDFHHENHNGINTVQKRIAAEYHWSGMRDTITRVIHQCPECRAASHSSAAVPMSRALRSSAPSVSTKTEIDREGDSTPVLVSPAPAAAEPLRSSRDLYATERFGWENIVYLPPEEDDGEYVPETELGPSAAVITDKHAVDDFFLDDDLDWNEIDDDEEEYMDDGNDDDDDDDEENDDGDESHQGDPATNTKTDL